MITELTPPTPVEPDVRRIALHALVRDLADARGDVPHMFQVLADCVTTLVATRDASSRAVDDADLDAIETYIGYTRLAAESTLMLEAERSEARAERERTSRFKHEMLGIVGHDLRAPLGAILIGTEMLALDTTRDANAVMQIVSFAKRMTRIVDQVLDLTRLRLGGGIPLARCQTRLLPILESAIERLAASNPGARVALTLEVDARGQWDMDRLAQVISSLLDNAVQYGRDGGAITVAVTWSAGVTTIAVHNQLRDGPITPGVLATVFEPPLGSEPVGLGWGLGLQISSAIVRGHGGMIKIESSPAGTCVEVSLPNTTA